MSFTIEQMEGNGESFVMDRADWETYLREHHSYKGS